MYKGATQRLPDQGTPVGYTTCLFLFILVQKKSSMHDLLYDKFNGCGFLLIPEHAIVHLPAEEKGKKDSWRKAFAQATATSALWKENRRTIFVSAPVQGYCLVDGLPINDEVQQEQICTVLSDYSTVYYFATDLGVPMVAYQKYAHGQRVRNFKYVVEQAGDGTELTDEGVQEAFEHELIYTPSRNEDPLDFFWFPMRILSYWSITEKSLLAILEQKARVMTLHEV